MNRNKSSKSNATPKNSRKSDISRRRGSIYERPVPYLDEKQTMLIVCEGKNTEPSYFNQFRLSSATIKTIGTGFNTISLVEKAKKFATEDIYDQVWCVFDADPKPDNPNQSMNFNEAIRLAEKYNFGVAYSNQAFEYWIILHLSNHQGGRMPRTDYHDKINELLKPYQLNYDGKKRKIISEDLFDFLNEIDIRTKKKRVELAIQRAENIYNLYDHNNPASEESSTTVFKLVKEILKYV